ncbi:thiamine pyrophosphate-binding protein [Cellulomonas sp. URHE0023]|uniref:thiamine pyrophosphate-binding protein n=1 Tax=Cellulomonas sp. URHE0023 TaxID=1380354 RepID=UPI00054CE7E8|nr:thiamine pyrophosphate-binding protein [Cellulomonas sp. URHE0023]
MSTPRTVASFLASALPDYGVSHVFELVGGMVTVLIDSMHENPALTVVSVHHEQGGGFAAEGFARTSGRPSVALATSGPGATNLLTAVGSCYFDSTPVVFITGQVNRHELREYGRGRQGGFQETDIVSMVKPVTKWAKMTTDPDTFADDLAMAFQIATSGRPGPVLLDIPMDVQRSLVPESASSAHLAPDLVGRAQAAERDAFIERLGTALAESQRPLVLAGGGLRSSHAIDDFRAAVEKWQVPVATSLMGVDAIESSSPYDAGFYGSYGNRWTNWAISQADLLLVLGSRLDVRQTGSDVDGFRSGRQVFHVDIDCSELNNRVLGSDVLCDDVADFLPPATRAVAPVDTSTWLAEIAEKRAEWPHSDENVPVAGINPNLAVQQMSEAWPELAAVVTDVGQHQMWAAQSIVIEGDRRFLTSGGMGSMGFGLPAAIGSALAAKGRPVALIAGDGGFQCNIQELQTLKRLQLPLRVVIFDNQSHGMVRQFQESYFGSRFYSTKWGYSAPDFTALATAYGIAAWHVGTHDELLVALKAIDAAGDIPSLLHVDISGELNAYPKMAFGRPFGSMEPDVAPTEMEGT